MKETDVGNSEYLFSILNDDFRFCTTRHDWYFWTGTYWAASSQPTLYSRAKDALELLHTEAGATGNKGARRWAETSENISRIKAMLELVQWEKGISVSEIQFDRNPWFLNLEDGTVDLCTGTLLKHARTDMLSNLIPIFHDPAATCPRWESFLTEIFASNPDIIPFIQRSVGYSMTGDTREQVLFFLHGDGKNGKSVFLNTLHALLGPYARHCQSRTLMASGGDSTSDYDVARLVGARLVTAVESRSGSSWNEELVKQLTGGDATITARHPYRPPFEFRPSWKIWFSSNNLPNIVGHDYAIWRRIRLIPFAEHFEGEHQDDTLESKLLLELPGILNWALAGAVSWFQSGLHCPLCVMHAVEEYRRAMDVLGPFLEDVAVIHPLMRVPVGDLYNAYMVWAGKNATSPIGKYNFGSIIKGKRGISQVKNGSIRYWIGIGIGTNTASLSEFSDDEEDERDN